MAFSDLGKLLEVVEDIAKIIERTSGLPNNVARGDLYQIRSDILLLKQREEYQ